jgi:RNA polymerase sigma-70 factor, ECF subfamily
MRPEAVGVRAVTERVDDYTAARREVAGLYDSSRVAVYRYLLGIGLENGQAEEVTQEAFLRLYAALRNGEFIANLKGWLFQVAHNLALDILKRRRPEVALSDWAAAALTERSSSAEEKLIENEWQESFQREMQSLSKRQRLCLELRAQGLRYQEIAELLDIKTSTVAELLRRGFERLRKWNQCRT